MSNMSQIAIAAISIILFMAGAVSSSLYQDWEDGQNESSQPKITLRGAKGVQAATIMYVSQWMAKNTDGAFSYMSDPWFDHETNISYSHNTFRGELWKYDMFTADAWGYNDSTITNLFDVRNKEYRYIMAELGAEWVFTAHAVFGGYPMDPFHLFWSYELYGWECVGGSFAGLCVMVEG